MLIRCEKCSTLYELDDKVLPPQGAPVQCSKCQFVFKAYPEPVSPQGAPQEPAQASNEPRGALEDAVEVEIVRESPPLSNGVPDEIPLSSGDDLVREGGALAGSRSERAVSPPPAAPRSPAPRAVPASSPSPSISGEQQFTADGRPIRKVPFPSAEPTQPGTRPPVSVRAPARRALPVKWIVPAAVVALIVLAVLAWLALGHHGRSTAQPQVRQRQSRVDTDASRGTARRAAVPDDPSPRAAPDPYAPAAAPAGGSSAARAQPAAGTEEASAGTSAPPVRN